MKLDVPEDEILYSSFDEWHMILNDSPIVYDESEWNDFEEKGFLRDEVIKTWERLFDHQWLASRPSDWSVDYKKHWMQGVTPRITMNQVVWYFCGLLFFIIIFGVILFYTIGR